MSAVSSNRAAATVLLKSRAASLHLAAVERPRRSALTALLEEGREASTTAPRAEVEPPEPSGPPALPDKDWLTAAEVAAWMGVAERDVAWAAERDELPSVQIGRARLFSRAALVLFPLERWRARHDRSEAPRPGSP